jgi:GNAT superfamily N-acetyltransferase
MPAIGYPLTELAALFTRVFAGYLVPVHVTAEALASRIRIEHIDLDASRVVVASDRVTPLALALIARRGRDCRLAVFGVIEAARGQGLGLRAMAGLIEEARARGDHRMLLEVFDANTAGVGLYERLGFRTARGLIGWDGPLTATPDLALREVDPSALGHALARHGDPAEPPLPWQLRAECFIAMAAPFRTFTIDERAFATVLVRGPALHVCGLFTRPDARRAHLATRLVRAIAAETGCARGAVPPLVPAAVARGCFDALGLQRSPLAQREMVRDLCADRGA